MGAAGRRVCQRPPKEPDPTRPSDSRSAPRRGALGRGSPPAPSYRGPRRLSVYTRAGKGRSVIWHRVGTDWTCFADGERLGFRPAIDIRLIPLQSPQRGSDKKFIQDP